MASIHPIAYVLVGGGVAGFSYYMNGLNMTNAFNLFLWVGIAMLIFGIGKLALTLAKRSNEARPKPQAHQSYHHTGNAHHPAQRHQTHHLDSSHPQAGHPGSTQGYCYGCGLPIQHNYFYCPRCGARLR
ncbi:TPA: hypothetical protein HA361_04400 [Candidatus Woesearchaeota archaeon]|nr:hypothetical protein [Candidatus Woesearchaeota archaeon]HII68323.1 hypothetical protein [Candidatus Woesearchaeota archaeon]